MKKDKIGGRHFVADFKSVRRSNAYVSIKTGEVVPWNASEQSVWTILWDQQHFFEVELGKKHYNTMAQLSEMSNVSKSTVRRAVEKFERDGIVAIERSVKGNKTNFVYTSVQFPTTAYTSEQGVVLLGTITGLPVENAVDVSQEIPYNPDTEHDYSSMNIVFCEEDEEYQLPF